MTFMKKFLSMLLLGIFSTMTVYSAEIPLTPALEAQFDKLQKKTVKARWTAPSMGTSTLGGGGPYALGPVIPGGAVITDSYIKVVTQIVDAAVTSTGPPTLAIHCEDANNILSAADLTSHAAGVILGGARYGNVAATVGAAATGMAGSIGADCAVTATLTRDNASAGELLIYIDYVVGN